MARLLPVHVTEIATKADVTADGKIVTAAKTETYQFRTSDTYDGLSAITGITKVEEASQDEVPCYRIEELIRHGILKRVICECTKADSPKKYRLEVLLAFGKDPAGLEANPPKEIKVNRKGATVTYKVKYVITPTSQSMPGLIPNSLALLPIFGLPFCSAIPL